MDDISPLKWGQMQTLEHWVFDTVRSKCCYLWYHWMCNFSWYHWILGYVVVASLVAHQLLDEPCTCCLAKSDQPPQTYIYIGRQSKFIVPGTCMECILSPHDSYVICQWCTWNLITPTELIRAELVLVQPGRLALRRDWFLAGKDYCGCHFWRSMNNIRLTNLFEIIARRNHS